MAHQNINNSADAPYGGRTALVVCDAPERRQHLAALAKICDCHILDSDIDGDIAPAVDLLLVDIGSIMERQESILSNVLQYLHQHHGNALIWTRLEDVELAYAILPPQRCQFLVDSSDFEAVPFLTGAIGRGKMEQLHDNNRDGEFGDLHRISDELADFAKTLARIAKHDEPKSYGVSDKPVSFRAAPANIFHPFIEEQPVNTAAIASGPVSAAWLRDLIKVRRMRDNHFSPELFADPAWDILLDLMAAQLEGRPVSVSSLCIAAAVPATTALRWVTGMTESGMLVRRMDPSDARRVFIELSDGAVQSLESYFAAVVDKAVPVI